MATREIITTEAHRLLNIMVLATMLTLTALAGSAAPQSTDRDNPTRLTANEASGRFSGIAEHYYSFVAGPGEVKVLLDGKADEHSTTIYAELSDADGRLLTNLEGTLGGDKVIEASVTSTWERYVARYQVKRRQPLVLKIYTLSNPGLYKVRLEGAVALGRGGDPPVTAGRGNVVSAGRIDCLPRSGILRIVMNDGTTQEINLSGVRETSLKP
jgi:hypothetical protein